MSRLLAQKGKIGNVELKNRLVMAPMGDLTANPEVQYLTKQSPIMVQGQRVM